jgi:hypothetical protein
MYLNFIVSLNSSESEMLKYATNLETVGVIPKINANARDEKPQYTNHKPTSISLNDFNIRGSTNA